MSQIASALAEKFISSIDLSSNICLDVPSAVCGKISSPDNGLIGDAVETNIDKIRSIMKEMDIVTNAGKLTATELDSLRGLVSSIPKLCNTTKKSQDSSQFLELLITTKDKFLQGVDRPNTKKDLSKLFGSLNALSVVFGAPLIKFNIAGDIFTKEHHMRPVVSASEYSPTQWNAASRSVLEKVFNIKVGHTDNEASVLVNTFELSIRVAITTFIQNQERDPKFSLTHEHIMDIIEKVREANENPEQMEKMLKSVDITMKKKQEEESSVIRSIISDPELKKHTRSPWKSSKFDKKLGSSMSKYEKVEKMLKLNLTPSAPSEEEDYYQDVKYFLPTRDELTSTFASRILSFDLDLNSQLELLGAQTADEMAASFPDPSHTRVMIEPLIHIISKTIDALINLYGIRNVGDMMTFTFFSRLADVFLQTSFAPACVQMELTNQLLAEGNGGMPIPSLMDVVLDFFIVDANREDNEKRQALAYELAAEIVDAFKFRVDELPWASREMKALAKKKASSINIKTGWASYLDDENSFEAYVRSRLDNSTVQELISAVVPDKNSDLTIDNVEVLSVLLRQKDIAGRLSLWGKIDEDLDFLLPQTVTNAWYMPERNSISIPLSIIQEPFFALPNSKKVTENVGILAVTYGGLGYVIGHELTHGFDNNGANFDEFGVQNPWMPQSDRDAFESLTHCLVDQFSRFSNYGRPLNPVQGGLEDGNVKLGENIADLGGVTLAFRALNTHLSRNIQWSRYIVNNFSSTSSPNGRHAGKALNPEEPQLLPGVSASSARLYYLTNARTWCQFASDVDYRQRISDPHAPGHARSINAIRNGEFSREVFGCEKASTAQGSPNVRATSFSGAFELNSQTLEERKQFDTNKCSVW